MGFIDSSVFSRQMRRPWPKSYPPERFQCRLNQLKAGVAKDVELYREAFLSADISTAFTVLTELLRFLRINTRSRVRQVSVSIAVEFIASCLKQDPTRAFVVNRWARKVSSDPGDEVARSFSRGLLSRLPASEVSADESRPERDSEPEPTYKQGVLF